jgi:hypothetical protein
MTAVSHLDPKLMTETVNEINLMLLQSNIDAFKVFF